MTKRSILPPLLLLFFVFLASNLHSAAAAEDDIAVQRSQQFFLDQVLPVLKSSCYECHSHGAGESSGGLMLDSLAAMQAGGSRGASLSMAEPQTSLILEAIGYTNSELQMPPDEKLDASQIAAIRRWLQEGAHVPADFRGDPQPAGDAAAETSGNHWAYIAPRPWVAQQPAPAGAATKVDEILLHKLAAQGLTFSPRADRRTLIRRVCYDLTGLPPSFLDVERFEQDPRTDAEAFAELVEQLLSSPHFGERFARYWMDVARYADNKGYVFQEDREFAEAYRYRDWLIDAFNADLPYDKFISQQLAADLLAAEGDTANLPALGFITLGRRFINNKLDIIDDRLDVVTRGLMGMTLACARCHDHKYDPITQADYYGLAGVFLNSEEPGDGPWPHRLQDATKLRDAYVLYRGSPANVGPKVDRKFVSFLDREQRPFDPSGSGRADLASHIASPTNPLTARVLTNRIWMRLTGASLVETPSDFGLRCPPPAQLELLDHLAISFIQNDWSIKALVREIVLSNFYAQSSLDSSEGLQLDPENQLYWKMNRRRLDFEALRDTLLAATENLDRRVLGKSETIHAAPYSHRRTVYAYIDRQNLPSVFRTFDMASPDTHNARRAETSVPQQGLFLLNSDFVMGSAETLASRIAKHAAAHGPAAALTVAFQAVLGRTPTVEEEELLLDYMQQAEQDVDALPPERWICGYGEFNPQLEQLESFSRLPARVKGCWQGGKKLPDDRLGWCMLNAAGGHPGNNLAHAVVRRWIAPADGKLTISGRLTHPADEGDGVRATVLLDGRCLGRWLIQHGQTDTDVVEFDVLAGQHLDFVTDCVASPNHDSFRWPVKLNYSSGTADLHAPDQVDSVVGFPGERNASLSPWAQVVQILLATNELAFVD